MAMKNSKSILTGIIALLVLGIIFLGYQVQKLRAEVGQVLQDAKSTVSRHQQKTNLRAHRPEDWFFGFNDEWAPYSELAQIHRQMNRLFGQAFQAGLPSGRNMAKAVYGLSTDIKDTKDKYILNMDIPGMEKENIDVEVRNNILFVSGERKNQDEEKNNNYYRQERSFGYFSQRFPLPADADTTGISVNYNKGVLTIQIPKLAKAQSARTNRIKVN